MGDLSEHFSTLELACPHCGECNATASLIFALEKLRSLGPEPIIIHDGYRCPEHNLAVGGVPNSQHVLGEAADLDIVGLDLQAQYDRAKTIAEFAAGGIGVYSENFIHLDVRKNGPARWARKNGKMPYIALEALVTP